jgi:hypothetical protein
MENNFDIEAAKKNLLAKEEKERNHREEERKSLLQKTISVLEKEFKRSSVEVYLIGSILQPFQFTARSDIDVVLKNFQGDRFELWPRLEIELDRTVDIISFERSHLQELILQHGFKVMP